MPVAFIALIALSFILPFGILVLAIVAIAGGRADPDPNRERPYALYLTAAAFAGVFTLLFTVFGVATSLLELTVDEDGQSFAATFDGEADFVTEDGDDEDDEDVSAAVQVGIAAVLAAGVYGVHDRRLRRFSATAAEAGLRVRDSYVYVTCFVALVTAVVATTIALYGLFEAAAPGITGTEHRSEGVVQFASLGILAAGAALVFLRHWRIAQGRATLPPEVVTPPPPSPPPAPPVSSPPVKKATRRTAKATKSTRPG